MKNPARANSTATRLSVENDEKAKILAICFVGFIAMLLTVAGAISFFVAPDRSKDVWVIVGPILTGAISGLLGFWAGAARRKA